MAENPLGKQVPFPERYSPDLLAPIPRKENRAHLGIRENSAELPFSGVDVWNAYELSWLGPTGKPVVAILQMLVPCESPCIVESKSLKLYLSSFNQENFGDFESLQAVIHKDLEQALGMKPDVRILFLHETSGVSDIEEPDGVCLDTLAINVEDYQPRPELLVTEAGEMEVKETLYSHLFRSNCPITGQPDWATVSIAYHGRPISHEALLQYLVSYRRHNDYHENCVERIFLDIQQRCQPQTLSVQARFTRRGGIDINPLRVTPGQPPNEFRRLIRQ